MKYVVLSIVCVDIVNLDHHTRQYGKKSFKVSCISNKMDITENQFDYYNIYFPDDCNDYAQNNNSCN